MDLSAICDVRWVHVFEQDTPAGAVYKPDSLDIPLSRRPREALTLYADGTATFAVGGPDDRSRSRSGRWRETPDGIAVDVSHERGAERFLVITATSDRLVLASR